MVIVRTRRLMLAELFIFLTLVGTTALAFRPVMMLINKNIIAVREGIIKQAEEFLGRPIRYGSLSPSIISRIEVRELTVGDSINPLIAAGHLYIEYSLWDLIRGKGIGAVHNLILDRPEFSFDTKRDRDIQEILSRYSSEMEKHRQSSDSTKKLTLPSECLFDVREGKISFVNGNTVFSAVGVFINGEIRNGQISLNGVWHKDILNDEAVTMEGKINGSFSEELNRGSIVISIDSIESKGFTVERIGFILSFFEDRIVFEREEDGLPLELSAVYLHENGEFSGSFQANHFVPSRIIHFRGPLEMFDPVLSLSLSGNADFTITGNSGEYDDSESNNSYNFMLSGDIPNNVRESPVRSFIFEGNGNGKQLNFSQFFINAYSGFVRYAGNVRFSPLFFNGTLVFSDFSLTGDTSVNGSLSLISTDLGQTLNSSYLALGGTILASFSGEITSKPGGGEYFLGFDRYREKEGFTRTFFECRGFYSEKPGNLEGIVRVNNFFADDLYNLIRPFYKIDTSVIGVLQKTSVTAEIGFRTDFKGINYETRHFLAAYGMDTNILVSVKGNENHLELNNGILQWNKEQLFFDFSTDFSNTENVVFLCNLNYLDYNYDFEGGIRNGSIFTLKSNLGFSAEVINEKGRWSCSALGRVIPIPYRNNRSYLSFDAVLDYHNSSVWNLSLGRFEIQGNQGGTELFVQGQANQNGMNLDRIYYTDRAGPLSGSAVAIWNSNFSFIDASFILTNPNETEKIAGDLFYESGNLEFHGNVTNFKGERIATTANNLQFSGELNGGVSLEGYYLLNLSLSPLVGRIGESDFSLTGFALIDPEKLILSRINFSIGDIQSNIPYVSIDRNTGLLETEVQIFGIVKNHQLGMLLSLGMNFQPMKSWFDLGSFDSLSGIIDIPYAYINDLETAEQFSFIFTRTPINESGRTGNQGHSVYRISGGSETQNMLNAEFRENRAGSGEFFISLTNPSPAQGFISGFLDGTTIDAFASEVFIDLAGLWDILPMNKIVYFTGGTITGETRMFGSIYDPEFDGTAWGAGITLLVPEYIPVEIGPGSGVITLADSGFYFGPVDAPCGDGHGIVHASINFNRWLMSLDLTVDVDREIPFDFNISGVLANGNAKGTLNFLSEEEEIFTITGQVDASDTEITLNREEIESAMFGTRRSDESDIAADVLIKTGKRVEFFWPNARTPILRTYGESVTGVRIMADTRVPLFAMDGNITLRGGELFHISRSYYIREGLLEFHGNDPYLNPLISARGEIRDNNDDGPVTIFMIMDKVPLSELENTTPRYESIPALSLLEIYSILGLAPPMNTVAPLNTFNPMLRSFADATVILQPVVFRPIEQTIRNILGLDMFSLRTQILQNAVFETVRNREPDEQPATMGNYLDNTAVFMGKYFGPQLFGQAMLAFRYEQYRREYGGMRPELNIGLDLRSPLFDVRWNVGALHLENLYLNDFVSNQSISLIRRWSL
ncbi:MAG: hypothetical protein FWG07_06525 [Treponema sp.]|nr:hypothetical protein [Treponema sp.]